MKNKSHYAKYMAEVEEHLKGLSKKDTLTNRTEIDRIGISVPLVRKAAKMSFSFSDQPTEQQLLIWDYIWKHSLCYEAMSIALYTYQYKALSKDEFKVILTWVDRCNCWEDSDNLSKIYAQIVEEHPEWILPTLKKWNHSTFSWKRRQSVVSLLEYACKRKKAPPYETLIPFVDHLLEDDDYYVQKGVGWTLREIFNLYPDKTLAYLEENLLRLTPLAYTSATEKISKEIKKTFTAKRREARKK